MKKFKILTQPTSVAELKNHDEFDDMTDTLDLRIEKFLNKKNREMRQKWF